jgi:hypothetical protein
MYHYHSTTLQIFSVTSTSSVTTWLGQDVTKKIVLRLKCEEQLKNSSKSELRGTGVQGRKPSKIQVKNYNKMCNILYVYNKRTDQESTDQVSKENDEQVSKVRKRKADDEQVLVSL